MAAPHFDVTILLNGISLSVLYFLIATGLTLIFGLMGVINFAHGALALLGGYLAVSIIGVLTGLVGTNAFLVALLVAPVVVAVAGMAMEYVTLRPLYEEDAFLQVLLTFGVTLIVSESVILLWGREPKSLSVPSYLTGQLSIASVTYPRYRIVVIVVGMVLAAAILLLLERTRIGMIIRAATLDSEMVEVMGIDASKVFTLMFGFGAGLAAFGGIMSAPLFGLYPGGETELLLTSFIVVIVGGLGSVRGSLVGAFVVGMTEAIGSYYFSRMAVFVPFTLLIVVLLVRPHGLLGRPGLIEH